MSTPDKDVKAGMDEPVQQQQKTNADKQNTENRFLHLYEATNGTQKFYLLGTIHPVALSAFPGKSKEPIKALLNKADVFLMEGLFRPLTIERMEKTGYLRTPNEVLKGWGSWWNALSTAEQEAVTTLVTAIQKRHKITFDIERLTIRAVNEFFVRNLWENGLDAEIHMNYTAKKQVICLGDEAELKKIEEMRLARHEYLAFTKEGLKECIKSFCFDPEDRKLLSDAIQNYFTNETLLISNPKQAENIKAANQMSFDKITTCLSDTLKEGKEKTIIAVVGAAHLYDEEGLLKRFEKTGFQMQRMNTEGVFLKPANAPNTPAPVSANTTATNTKALK